MLKPPHYELFQTSQMPSFGNLKSVLNLTKFNSIPKCSQISQTLRHSSSPNARRYHSSNPRHRKESKVWTGFDPLTNELVTRRITNNGEDLGLGDENPSSEKPIVKKPVWSGYNSISRSEGGVGPPLRRTGRGKVNWVCQECGASDGQWWGTCPSCKATGSLKQFVDSERFAGSNKTRGLWLPRCPAEMRPRRLSEVNKGINKLEWRIPLKREVNMKVLKVPEIKQKVLDATSNEPCGPHGSALAEIAQATKKFTECQMIMYVLWTRLTDTGRNWRHVYKALTVIEYLVANGSECAVDDILEHTFQISSISGFEYVEPNGKDMGINVRKKVETILALLNNKDKIQEVRNKAAANRDKYFGLSSTGITNKSSSASHGRSSFHQDDHYGGLCGAREGETFKDGYKSRDRDGDENDWNHGDRDGFSKDGCDKSRPQSYLSNESKGSNLKKGSAGHSRGQDDNYGPIPSSHASSALPNDTVDDFDDFNPQASSTAGSTAGRSNQVDLFGESLIGDLLDAPVPTKNTTTNSNASTDVDLFADATFVSASPNVEAHSGPQTQAD